MFLNLFILCSIRPTGKHTNTHTHTHIHTYIYIKNSLLILIHTMLKFHIPKKPTVTQVISFDGHVLVISF